MRAHERFNEHHFSLNFSHFYEIEKTQMNKVFKGLDGLSQDRRLHCFIKSPANADSNEWFFAYASTDNTKTLQLLARSGEIIESHTGDHKHLSLNTDVTSNTTNVYNLLKVHYINQDLLNTTMLKDMLALANFEKSSIPSYFQMLGELSAKVSTIYRGISIYLTALCSWFDGFMYYPPSGFIKISDSHAFQLLVEIYGREKSIEVMKVRSRVLTFLSKCDLRIQSLIQKSIIVHYAIRRRFFTVFETYFDSNDKVSLLERKQCHNIPFVVKFMQTDLGRKMQ